MEEGECELCGRFGKLVEIEIEGSTLLVCERCAAFGEKPKQTGLKSAQKPAVSEREIVEEVVENYGERIRKAREAKGMTQEELAAKLQIRASLLAKIEREEMMPEIPLARKLERALGIKLVERVGEGGVEGEAESKDKNSYSMTLGDLIKLKKMDRE